MKKIKLIGFVDCRNNEVLEPLYYLNGCFVKADEYYWNSILERFTLNDYFFMDLIEKEVGENEDKEKNI